MLRQSPNQWLNKSLSGSFSGAHNFDVTETNAAQVIIPGHADVLAKGSNPIIFDSVSSSCPTVTNGCASVMCPSIHDCPMDASKASYEQEGRSVTICPTIQDCPSVTRCRSIDYCITAIDIK